MSVSARGGAASSAMVAAATAQGGLEGGRENRSRMLKFLLAACAGLLFLGFVALGGWQVWRLQWKLDLIARVDKRVHASPVAAPDRPRWAQVSADTDAYRHVVVRGIFLHDRAVRVQAVTVLGSGFWLMTPLRATDGTVVLVNRGFVRSRTGDGTRQESNGVVPGVATGEGIPVAITGLLRMTEAGGAFLRHNDAAGNRWYSRDVQAIAAAEKLGPVAPYFIDADAAASRSGDPESTPASSDVAVQIPEQPVGGLTVIAFHNNHLVYALTWFVLALMVVAACLYSVREERRLRRAGTILPTTLD